MKLLFSLLAAPLLAQQGVNFYTIEKERALGQQLLLEIRKQSKPLADPAVDAYVKRIGAELIAQLKEPTFASQFEVITDGDQIEPIPLPGGYILIPARSFLEAQGEAEFVGMLAHSIGHAALRHGTPAVTRGQVVNMASILLVYMGGWLASHADLQRPQLLMPLGFLEFQRTYELEADQFGLRLAAQAGYDAAGFERYMERRHPVDSKISPLPPREVRLARLQETVSSLPPSTRASSDEEFRHVQQVVRVIIKWPEQRRVPTLKR